MQVDLRRAGITRHFSPHCLRHTFASWVTQAGVDLHELMRVAGWKSYEMALRYAHLRPGQHDNVRAALDESGCNRGAEIVKKKEAS